MLRKFEIDPTKPFFVFDTAGDWQATKMGPFLFDSRGDYIGFVLGEQHDVFTADGEWVGNLFPDGRIVRKRNYNRPPLHPNPPKQQAKPQNLPGRAPLPPMCADLGYDKVDVLDWDPDVFKRISDLRKDAGE